MYVFLFFLIYHEVYITKFIYYLFIKINDHHFMVRNAVFSIILYELLKNYRVVMNRTDYEFRPVTRKNGNVAIFLFCAPLY